MESCFGNRIEGHFFTFSSSWIQLARETFKLFVLYHNLFVTISHFSQFDVLYSVYNYSKCSRLIKVKLTSHTGVFSPPLLIHGPSILEKTDTNNKTSHLERSTHCWISVQSVTWKFLWAGFYLLLIVHCNEKYYLCFLGSLQYAPGPHGDIPAKRSKGICQGGRVERPCLFGRTLRSSGAL